MIELQSRKITEVRKWREARKGKKAGVSRNEDQLEMKEPELGSGTLFSSAWGPSLSLAAIGLYSGVLILRVPICLFT